MFNQFNVPTSKVGDQPNWGRPDGWGMFQLDSARGEEVTADHAWNWKANLLSAIDEFDTGVTSHAKYMEAVRRTYPDKWESPPKFYQVPKCKTRLTFEEAAMIQLYNGAAVVKKLKTKWGSYGYYRSAWDFNPGRPAGRRWKFIVNKNDYVFRIINHEVEGNYPIEE